MGLCDGRGRFFPPSGRDGHHKTEQSGAECTEMRLSEGAHLPARGVHPRGGGGFAAAQGLDILNDPEAMRKFLNDPDNRAFRTTLERV